MMESAAVLLSCIGLSFYCITAYTVYDLSGGVRDESLGRHNLALFKRICALIWPIGVVILAAFHLTEQK